jgi:nucleoside-diphosphate-sugar epimerase
LTEESPLAPQGAYEQSKLKAEEECRAFLKNENLVILRSVNVVGWGQAPKAVLPVFFQKAKANQPLDIIHSPDTPMQFVYVDDLIDAIEDVIDQKKACGIFNLAHDETVSLEQLARKIIAMTGSSSVINITDNTRKNIFSPVSCAKARQQLGWKAKTGLTEILKAYLEEYAKRQ